MKKIVLFAVLALVLSSCAGVRGNGKVKRETRNVGKFTEIEVGGGFNVHLKQDDKEGLIVEADANLLDFIVTRVEGKELIIKTSKSISNFKKMDIYITYTQLEEINVSGACDLDAENTVKAEFLGIDASGASDIDLEIECDGLNIEASGSSDIDLRGNAEITEYDISGASDVNAVNLYTKRCKIECSGASSIKVNVSKKLEVSASGASSVGYRGNPKDVKTKVSGASSAKQL